MRYLKTGIYNLSVVLLLLVVSPAEGEEKPLRVAMSGEYMPLHGIQEGQEAGYEADLARALAKALGRPVQFLNRDQMKGGALAAVASGAADVALNAITPTPERAGKVDFTAPIAALDYLVAAAKGSLGEDFASVCPRTVAVAEGPAASALKAANPVQKIIVVKSTATAAAMPAQGKADCVVGEDIGLFMVERETELTIMDEPIGVSPIAMAVPKGQAGVYDEQLARIGEQLKDLRQKWHLQEPRAGLKYPSIAIRSAKSGKIVTRYVAIRSTSARVAPNAGAQVVFRLETGDVIDSTQPPQKGAWIETTKSGARAWVAADDIVNLAGPFFSIDRDAPAADPNQPCQDTPCGCIVYKPIVTNTIKLTAAGEKALNKAFAEAVSRNSNVYSRRKLARAFAHTLLDNEMHAVISSRAEGEDRFNKCFEGCGPVDEGDGCCDCDEPEQYRGIVQAFAALEQLTDSFSEDQDPEVARRALTGFCGFLRSHKRPEMLYDNTADAMHAFNGCGIEIN